VLRTIKTLHLLVKYWSRAAVWKTEEFDVCSSPMQLLKEVNNKAMRLDNVTITARQQVEILIWRHVPDRRATGWV
jgi:hypothetical protein